MIDLIFLNSQNSLQERNHSSKQIVWVYQVLWYLVHWFDLPNLISFITEDYSFNKTTSLSLDSMMIDSSLIDLIFLNSLHLLHHHIHSMKQKVWIWQVWWLSIDWFDLPNLMSFITEDYSFYKTNSLILDSMIIEYWLIRSS